MSVASALLLSIGLAGRCRAAITNRSSPAPEKSSLVRLGAAKFPNLTKCEHAILEFADLKTTTHRDPPPCGPSPKFDDPTNDPKNAALWDHQREVRAELIRWLFVDPEAVRQVDPGGVAALGARVVGILDLSNVHAPFGLTLLRCAIPELLALPGADIGYLNLSGSHSGEIFAGGSHIRGVSMDQGFEASATVFFGNSRIDGDFNCAGGSFKYENDPGFGIFELEKPALFLGVARVEGPVWLSAGFKAEGAVDVNGVTCTHLVCYGGKFINPGGIALNATSANISGGAILSGADKWSAAEMTGLVQFDNARLGGVLATTGAKFVGKPTEAHGFSATAMTAGGAFVWQKIELQNGATLDLRGASVNGLIDDERSWPQPGRLAIDGFVYKDFYGGPSDATSRLRWVGLQAGPHPRWLNVPSGFHPQLYRELAKVLRERGDEAGARDVLIAEDQALYAGRSLPVRAWGQLLRVTIGYGHAPLRAVIWSLAIVVLGWSVVLIANRAGVMRPTWPETPPAMADSDYEPLHPLLYSLDVFLPFVNLHQEHYWWPRPGASGDCKLMGLTIRCRGSVVRLYLWLQIIAGWLLSAIFLAGVTGLLRND